MTLVERLAKRRAKVELYTAYDRPSERCEKDARWWLNAVADVLEERGNEPPHHWVPGYGFQGCGPVVGNWLRTQAEEGK